MLIAIQNLFWWAAQYFICHQLLQKMKIPPKLVGISTSFPEPPVTNAHQTKILSDQYTSPQVESRRIGANSMAQSLLIFHFETTARGRYVYTVQIKTNYVRIKRNDSDFSPTEKKSENLHSHTFFIRKNSFYRNDSSNGGASEEVLNPKLSLIRAAKPHLTTKKVRSKIV